MLFVFENSILTFFLCTNAVTFYMLLWDLLWFYILAPACNMCAIMLQAQGKKPNMVILHLQHMLWVNQDKGRCDFHKYQPNYTKVCQDIKKCCSMLLKKTCPLAACSLPKCREKNCKGSRKRVLPARDQESEIRCQISIQ